MFTPDPQFDRKHRDPALVGRLAAVLAQIKVAHPWLRIGQILDSAVIMRADARDLFGIEDDDLVAALEAYAKQGA